MDTKNIPKIVDCFIFKIENKNNFTTIVKDGSKYFIYFDRIEPYFRDSVIHSDIPYSRTYINDPKKILKILNSFIKKNITVIKDMNYELNNRTYNIETIIKEYKIFRIDLKKYDEEIIDINEEGFLSEELNPNFEIIKDT